MCSRCAWNETNVGMPATQPSVLGFNSQKQLLHAALDEVIRTCKRVGAMAQVCQLALWLCLRDQGHIRELLLGLRLRNCGRRTHCYLGGLDWTGGEGLGERLGDGLQL